MQRLLFLAVLAERHDAVELLVVLTANLTAELIHLILKVKTFTLTAGSLFKSRKQDPLVLRRGRAVISKTKPGNRNTKTANFADTNHLKGNVEEAQVLDVSTCSDSCLLFYFFNCHYCYFSRLLERKGWSHLPFQGFRFQSEGSSAVVAFQLHCVGSSGQRRLSVRGRLQSSVLGEIRKNMSIP